MKLLFLGFFWVTHAHRDFKANSILVYVILTGKGGLTGKCGLTGKGDLTGCGLHGYSFVSVHFSTGQSNIAGCF